MANKTLSSFVILDPRQIKASRETILKFGSDPGSIGQRSTGFQMDPRLRGDDRGEE
jgi:hypothetical protein